MEDVRKLIKEIKDITSTCTSSKKDEVRVMKAMMNDTNYKVAVFEGNGPVGYICPADEIRGFCASVISNTTKIPMVEAEHLASTYEFKKSEAEHMLEFNKEFINTYLATERKLPLGGRKLSNASISKKYVKAGPRSYPKPVGKDKNGNNLYDGSKTYINAYESIKVFSPAPQWVQNKPEQDPVGYTTEDQDY